MDWHDKIINRIGSSHAVLLKNDFLGDYQPIVKYFMNFRKAFKFLGPGSLTKINLYFGFFFQLKKQTKKPRFFF